MSESPAAADRSVLMRDGVSGVIRGLSETDRAGLLQLHDGLSPQTLYLRFFTESRLSSERYVTRLLRPGTVDHAGIVLVVQERIVGVAAYELLEVTTEGGSRVSAEVAFVVADDQHGRGIGTLLLEHLASVARRAGITHFLAETLPQNAPMLGVFRDAGYTVTLQSTRDDVQVTIDLTPDVRLLSVLDRRERRATRASLEPLFHPRSVAIVGASAARESVGGAVVGNLLRAGYEGSIYPVNRRAASQRGRRTVHGMRVYGRLVDVPGPVDLVVVAVPAAGVLAVVDESAAVRARAMVVLSAGFADTGPEGAALETALRTSARRAGIRLIGPNCLGIVSLDEKGALAATFAPKLPQPGRVGVLSQSGGVGMALLDHVLRAGLGVSSFVSVGNKADVSGNDLLSWWDEDPATDIAALYLESFGNPRKFARLARHMSLHKPVVAIKAGRTAAGKRAAAAHSAAPGMPSRSTAALFRQAGVISVDHLGELVDVVTLLSTQPLTSGPRVAIVGTTGGLNVLAADAAMECGLDVATLTAATVQRLQTVLPVGASVGNPVDTTATAGSSEFGAAVTALLADPGIDAVLAVVTPTLVSKLADVILALAEASAGSLKPVLATGVGSAASRGVLASGERAPIPLYPYPESAARALAYTSEYRRFRDRPTGAVPHFADVRPEESRKIISTTLQGLPGGGWIYAELAHELLATYGIEVIAAGAMGGAGPAQADSGAGGVRVVVGVTSDPVFGPLISFGLAGPWIELLGDEGFRLVPLTDIDADELVHSIRAAPLLNGYHGAPQCDTDAIKQLLLRIAQLADDNPEVLELTLDPVIASPSGVLVARAAIRLERAKAGADPYARQLR